MKGKSHKINKKNVKILKKTKNKSKKIMGKVKKMKRRKWRGKKNSRTWRKSKEKSEKYSENQSWKKKFISDYMHTWPNSKYNYKTRNQCQNFFFLFLKLHSFHPTKREKRNKEEESEA